jgi:hypothetical protein
MPFESCSLAFGGGVVLAWALQKFSTPVYVSVLAA